MFCAIIVSWKKGAQTFPPNSLRRSPWAFFLRSWPVAPLSIRGGRRYGLFAVARAMAVLLGGSLFYCPWDFLRLAGVWRETKQRWRGYDKKGFTYKSQYAVVVICSDEEEQEHTYEKLKAEGYRLKVVAV